MGGGNGCEGERGDEGVWMGEVVEGLGKKKKKGERGKERGERRLEGEGSEWGGRVVEEDGG